MYETDDFLAHYGKKGMKWGVRKEELKEARKAGRRELRENIKGQYRKDSGKLKKGRTAYTTLEGVSAVMTGGASLVASPFTAAQVTRAAGYSKGKSIAIGILGGLPGAVLASEIRVRKNVKAAYVDG